MRYGGRVVAAKVYKDRAQRSFKNNAEYKEGRQVRNSRSQRAIERGSRFGQAAAEDAWKSAEVDALYKLHAAEVRVPTPVMYLEGVLLMELVLDADGDAAPRIIDTDLTVDEANAAYRDMLTQLVRILSCDLIHGDLSAYNVLWAAQGPTIIDFPQAISASHNSRSEFFFLRDANNILGHFAAIDRSLMSRSSDAAEIWRAYMRRELSADFVPTGRMRPPPRPHAAPSPPRGQAREPRAAPQPPQRPPQQHRAPQPPQRPPMQHQPQQRPQQQQHQPPPRAPRPQPPPQQRPPQPQQHQPPQRSPQPQQHQPPQRSPQPQQHPQRPHAQRGAPRRPVHTPEVFVRRAPQAPPPAEASRAAPAPESDSERGEAPAHRRRQRRR